MNAKNLKQVLSTSLSLALAVTSAPMPARAVGPVDVTAPAFVTKLTPPEQFGYVASSFAPKGESTPRLIVISTLHGHLEVQQNIMGMLENYVSTLTSSKDGQETRVPIYLEGAWKKNMEHPLATITDPKFRAVLSEYMLHKVEMQGVQAYTERHPAATNFTVTGVDNEDQYERNRAVFAKSYAVRKLLLEAILKQERDMNELENFVASSSYEKARDMRSQYEKGELSGDRYAKVLWRTAVRCGIHNSQVEALKNASTLSNTDLEVALLDVYRQVLVKLAETTKPVLAHFRRDINQEPLVKRNLAYSQGYMDILKRLMSDQLTPEEVTYANQHFDQLVKVAQALLADQKGIDIAGALKDALSFYVFAFLRDDSLVHNALAELDKDATHPTTGILVAGGFHTGYITEYLREHQIAFLQINPVITRDILATEQLNYVKRLCGDHVTIDEAAVDFRQPWMDSVVKDTAARMAASTAEVKGDDSAPEGTNLGGGVKRLTGFANDVGVVDQALASRLAVQGTLEGNKYFKAGTVQGDIAATVSQNVEAAVVANQMQVGALTSGTLFKADESGRWSGQGADVALFNGIVDEVANSNLIKTEMRNLDRVDEIEFVLTDKEIQTVDKETGAVVKHDKMAVLTGESSTPGKQKAIIMINSSKGDIQAINAQREAMIVQAQSGNATGAVTVAQQQAQSFVAGLKHELVHATSKPGWVLGDTAQTYVNINMVVSEAARMGGVEAVDSSVVPAPLVALTLRGLEPLLKGMGLTPEDVIAHLGDADNVGIGNLRDSIAKAMQLVSPENIEANKGALIQQLVNEGFNDFEAHSIVNELPYLTIATGQLSPADKRYVAKRMADEKEEKKDA